MSVTIGTKRGRVLPLVPVVLFLALSVTARAGDADWTPLAAIRFGNIDAIDAEDGDLATFMKSIRNDGRFIPPLHTLVGPEIRNTTFYGLTYEGWLEGLVLAPPTPGPTQNLWIFPVDNRDEYMTQMANLGLSEYEGMDGVTRLRELDADGNAHTWYMEWLPGNVAIFGGSRDAVAATRRIYAENIAARGLLHHAGGQYVEPDVMLRFFPARVASWQDSEFGQYWWRNKVGKLTDDLVAFWSPNPARERLLRSLAERFVLWPRNFESLDLSLWFEREGIEWRMAVRGETDFTGRGQLATLRQTPERVGLAYAVPVTPARFAQIGERLGAFLLGAAGGVVSQEVRVAATDLWAALAEGGLREAIACWVAPPPGRPELGAARMLISEWATPERLAESLQAIETMIQPGTPVAYTLGQMGLAASLESYGGDPDAKILRIVPAGGEPESEPYYDGGLVLRRSGSRVVLVAGSGRADADQMRAVMAYRAALADDTLAYDGPGRGDVRLAFTRMGEGGATFLSVFHPVRFLQLCLVEAADWRPRSPDQHEPLSTQLAREMLEYGAGRAWTAGGEADPGRYIITGGIPWQSLARVSAALGITESISMDGIGE
ncbi:MAG: hypothetical protein LUE17_08165 [Planctomycetaceae bacterium]|nr:hypothetical protein [Planctomycetaceae bacterium]